MVNWLCAVYLADVPAVPSTVLSMDCTYIALFYTTVLKAFYIVASHSPIHSHIHTQWEAAAMQGAANQGHFDMLDN